MHADRNSCFSSLSLPPSIPSISQKLNEPDLRTAVESECVQFSFFRVLESEFAVKYARIDWILSFAEWWKLKYPISNCSVKYHVMCTCVDFVTASVIPPGRWGWNQCITLDVEMKEGFAPTMEKNLTLHESPWLCLRKLQTEQRFCQI